MSGGVTCDRCGIARPGELRLVGIALDRQVSVERELCRPCAEIVLGGMGDALDQKPSERFELRHDGIGPLVDRGVPDIPIRRRRP